MKMPGLFEGRMCQKCLPDDNYAQLQSFVQQRLAGQERSVCLATAKDPHVAFTDWSGCLVPPKQNQQKKKERAIVWLHRGKCYSLIDEQPNVAKASRDTSAAVFAKARGPAEAHTNDSSFQQQDMADSSSKAHDTAMNIHSAFTLARSFFCTYRLIKKPDKRKRGQIKLKFHGDDPAGFQDDIFCFSAFLSLGKETYLWGAGLATGRTKSIIPS